jgi:phospholipase/carboxylesterase
VPENPHLAAAPLHAGAPLAEAAAVAVLVHGRGQGPATMLDLARRLALDDVAYLLPVADAATWYPERFTAPAEANEPRLSWALEACAAAVEQARRPVAHLALVGFSQGACLTLEYVARNPRRYGAVAGLTGGLIGTDDALTTPGAELGGTPLLVTTKEGDDWVPAARTRASAEILAAAGAAVDLRIMAPGAHAITDEEVDVVRALVRGVRA